MVSNAPPIIVFFPQYDIAIADGCYTMLQLLRLRVPNARTPFRLRPGKVHSLSHSLTRLSAGWLFVYDFSMTDYAAVVAGRFLSLPTLRAQCMRIKTSVLRASRRHGVCPKANTRG